MNLTYYGMSTRHLITRVKEHLDFNSIQRSAIKDYILFFKKRHVTIFSASPKLVATKGFAA